MLRKRSEYPPKCVLTLANKYANSSELEEGNFSGGDMSYKVLKQLQFEIVQKDLVYRKMLS